MRDVDGNVDRMRIDLDHLPHVLAALDTTAAPITSAVNLQKPNGRSEQIDLTAVELDSSGAPISAGVPGSRRGVPVGAVSNGAHVGSRASSPGTGVPAGTGASGGAGGNGNGSRGSHRAHGPVGTGWPTGTDVAGSGDRPSGGPA
jgi:hypothetical protein